MRMIALLLALSLAGCAANAPPETNVARVGTTVLAAATELQKGITAATDALVLPVPIAQRLTGYVQIIYDRSGPMSAALKAYHAATELNVRTMKASEVQAAIGDINKALGQILGTALPEGTANQISALAGNVMAAVAAVQLEIANTLGMNEVAWALKDDVVYYASSSEAGHKGLWPCYKEVNHASKKDQN